MRGIASGHSEYRISGGAVRLEFVFDEAVYSDDGGNLGASDFTSQNGTINMILYSVDCKRVILGCNGVANGQCLDISFVVQDVDEYANTVGLQFEWPILQGDANDDGLIDAADQSLVISEDAETATSTDFRCDLEQNGLVEANVHGSRLDLDLVTVTTPPTTANCGS